MGFLRGMKDLKGMAASAPAAMQAAQEMAAAAQQQAAQQQAAMAAGSLPGAAVAAPPSGAAMEPIAGVSLELFAEISRGLAAYDYDQSKAPTVAAKHGVSADNWQAAVDGWNQRITADKGVAQAFHRAYVGGQ